MKLDPLSFYKIMFDYFGTQKWWPIDENYHKSNNSDYRYEIILGSILTQNTTWFNVEKALCNIKNNKKLDIKSIFEIDIKFLQELIKSSGFFKQKALIIKNISEFIYYNYNNLDKFFNRDLKIIRNELLSLKGIGPETADSILLYAGNKPIFVVDNYTKRICNRLPIETEKTYNKIQEFFENNLRKKFSDKEIIKIYKEFHALIVLLCKNYCKKIPECKKCLINKYCHYYKNLL
jgi:endonuclease-3 related protein